MRGGGTSQAGQAIGAGLIIDTSKYLNAILDLNVQERWCRVEPGVVLDELNAHLRPHGLRFAPDVSTASRATIGGMMANNSSGARSVIYGKTIDHVIEQDVVLSDGSVVTFGPLAEGELASKCSGDTLEARCYRTVAELAARHQDEIERRFPKVLRRVGGYNLDDFRPGRPFNLARLMVGSEGTLGVVLSAKLNLVPLPNAKAVMAIQFEHLLESLAATPVILRHEPSAVEVMDKSILDHTRKSAALEALRQSFIEGDPGALLCVEFYDDRAEDLPPRLQALERESTGASIRLSVSPRARPAGAGANLEPARSGPRTVDGDAGGRQVALVRRGHGGRTGAVARLHRALPRPSWRVTIRPPASTLTRRSGCLHVRPVVNMKTDSGVQQVRGDRQRHRRSRARVRRSALR